MLVVKGEKRKWGGRVEYEDGRVFLLEEGLIFMVIGVGVGVGDDVFVVFGDN